MEMAVKDAAAYSNVPSQLALCLQMFRAQGSHFQHLGKLWVRLSLIESGDLLFFCPSCQVNVNNHIELK